VSFSWIEETEFVAAEVQLQDALGVCALDQFDYDIDCCPAGAYN
jgi:hypothetical protein